MKFTVYIKEAFLNLSAKKLRSTLALLGILVGTASVVAMVSGGELATNEALKQFKVLGTDLLSITISDDANEHDGARNRASIQLSDVNGLLSADKNILDVAPYTQVYNPVQYNGHPLSAPILGVTDAFARITHIDLLRGRFVSTLDNYALYCVIGNALYQELKKISYLDPLGKQLQIGQSFYTIVGVAKDWPENSFVYADINSGILIPILSSATLSQYATISNIILKLKTGADIDDVNHHVTTYINQHIANKHLFFRSAKELIVSMTKQSQILTIFLGLIGSISLLVGGIGVMNIMLVSVVERRSEIGVRLAVGARSSDICWLFLVEAILLSIIGGLLGVVIGMLIAYLIALIWHWEFILFFLPPIIGFTVSATIGMFFGFYPAYQASQLDPIEALRS